MTATGPNEKTRDIVIIDELEPCPYLPGEAARMPLRMPLHRITPSEIDRRLAEGHRRTGEYIYHTQCPACRACEPIRIDCTTYRFSRNQRRVLQWGDRNLTRTCGPLLADDERVRLFNRHRRERGLALSESDIDLDEYLWGFVRSCFDSFEIAYRDAERLVCLAVCDQGGNSLSAVYTFFDPDHPGLGLGTYSILKQIEYCQSENLQYLYLGYYVAGSPHMQYKSRFLPNERLIEGKWIRFSQPDSSHPSLP